MSDTEIDDEPLPWLSISTVIRIERVYTSKFDNGHTQIDADCLTKDLWGEVFDLSLHQYANDSDELEEILEQIKVGEIYQVIHPSCGWGGGYITLFSPELLPFRGDKEAFNAEFDEDRDMTNQPLEWDYITRPKKVRGTIFDIKVTGTRRRGSMAIISIQTATEIVEGHLLPLSYQVHKELLQCEGELVFFGVLQKAETSEDNKARMIIDSIRHLNE